MNNEEYTFLMNVMRVIAAYLLWRGRNRVRRSVWSRQIFLQRNSHGHGSHLLPFLGENHPELFFNYTQMSIPQFDVLLSLVEDKIKKQTTRLREPIHPRVRLAICLRFLATGMTFTDLPLNYLVGYSTVCKIIPETCQALIDILQPAYLNMPSSPQEWADIATGFEYRWNFPHCVGALDGKHIAIQAPANSGSSFINYKGFHSIVLMAACDAFYCFTFVDVGNYGRLSDGGVFRNTYLAEHLNNSNFLPPSSMLPSSTRTAPYVFIADEAFPLQANLMRPYPGRYLPNDRRIFNYRLSRGRRCIENAFGIMAARWRVLRTKIATSPELATLITLTCCCLHNYMMKTERPNNERTYCPLSFSDNEVENGVVNEGGWRSDTGLTPMERQSYQTSEAATNIREIYKNYFMSEGSVPWQFNNL